MKFYLFPLLPLSLLYGAVLRVRAWVYAKGLKKSYSVGVKVISIGNITVGGTGKTPMAAYLLSYLQNRNLKVGYLSRGYGRKSKGFWIVDGKSGNSEQFGDEALLIASEFPEIPVAVCEDRVEGARKLIEDEGIEVLILDDAFQHLRIRRDLDVVMIDATRPPLSDFPFPAGRLRESRSALKRADVFVLAKAPAGFDDMAFSRKLLGSFPGKVFASFGFEFQRAVAFKGDGAGTPIADFNQKDVVAFSGLGNNQHFHEQLGGNGINVLDFLGFADHHVYTREDYSKILMAARRQKKISGKFGAVPILTTEKDYHRLRANAWFSGEDEHPLYYVTVALAPRWGWEALKAQIDRLIES